MSTTQITLNLPDDIVLQIDSRLPPGGLMNREELASLLITLGLLSSQKIEVVATGQLQEFRQRKVDAAKSGMMGFLREYLDKIHQDPSVIAMPTESVMALETVIGAALGTGWVSAANAIMNLGIHPADILAACRLIGDECDYKIDAI
jgi:hypothetical protein